MNSTTTASTPQKRFPRSTGSDSDLKTMHTQRRNMNKLSKHVFCIAVIALAWIPVQASAQLTLDDFTSGSYVKHLNTGPTQDQHYAKLAPGSLLGAARQTNFSIGPNYYKQGAHLA